MATGVPVPSTVAQVELVSDDLGFVVGAVLAWALLPLLLLALVSQRPRRVLSVSGVVTGIVGSAALIGHWAVWLVAFDEVQGEPVPNHLFPATTALMWVSTGAFLILVVLAASAARRPRRG